MRSFTVASFNAHWGVAYFGALAGRRYDVVTEILRFDADVVVVPESWRFLDGTGILDPLRDHGYTVETLRMARMARPYRHWRAHPGDGYWELALCSRFPVLDRRELPMGSVRHDYASPRFAVQCTLDLDGEPLEMVAVHTSSKLWYAGPFLQLRNLAPQLPKGVPAVVAGDCNLWGPAVCAILRGWRRAVRGRTWPAVGPHSQIDHVLVNDRIDVRHAEVLPVCHSDHRPVRARLAPLT